MESCDFTKLKYSLFQFLKAAKRDFNAKGAVVNILREVDVGVYTIRVEIGDRSTTFRQVTGYVHYDFLDFYRERDVMILSQHIDHGYLVYMFSTYDGTRYRTQEINKEIFQIISSYDARQTESAAFILAHIQKLYRIIEGLGELR